MTSQVPLQSPLAELQNRFCIIDVNGDIRILDRSQIKQAREGTYRGEISFYKKPDGGWMMHRHLESLFIPCKPKDEIANFWINPSTVMYNQIAFTPELVPARTLNYWTGHTVTPAKGDCSLITNYLLEVICDGDEPSYCYLIKFIAHMLQYPEEKPGVVPVLLGGQGTGKGVFFQLLRSIWTRTTLQVSNVNEVVGTFNAALERNYIVCMDEALFSGDKRSMDRLKSIVTEPVIRIEQKHQPSRCIDSKHRFFAASNHDHFGPVDRDDRRFFFLRVSSCRQQDVIYFRTLCDSFNDGVTLEALVDFLLNLDLTGFSVRTRPKTNEHSRQKLQSLSGFERYWHEVLCTGNFSCGGLVLDEWKDPVFKATSLILEDYKEFDKQAGKYAAVQAGLISEMLKKLCTSAVPNRTMVVNKQYRGFDLPSISKAREEFEVHLGCSIDWDDS